VKQIGRELNVRYVLEGSVQRGGNRLRVNVQLIDAETGNHLWAERFDKPVADLFDMQDEIVARLANQIGTELIVAEARRAERSPHPDSMDLYFQGMACANKGLSPEYMSPARGYFERAVALDPGNLDALVGLALVDYVIGALHTSDDRVAHLTAAEATLNKVLSLAPNHAMAHAFLGAVLTATNRAAQGIAECERALVLDRNLATVEQAPSDGPHAMVRLLARVIGVGTETADMLVQEVLSRNMRDRRAVARYAGLTGSPDESGRKCREKGLARSGNARVRRGMIQLAWRLLMFQRNSALAQWFRARTENARGTRKTMIVALARKLLIALWRLVRDGVVPDGVVLRPAQ
jgi:tetratricopeptide (TPR) repeat protein